MTHRSPPFVPDGYTLLGRLGSGRTAHVFLAEHAVHGKVALKLPREETGQQPVLRRMFENEVQITLGLRHPNVVAAFDGSPTGARAFLALEYCSGGTLGERLGGADGPVPLAEARRLIVEVARGLEHSHGRQVIHRDVKPANVFLTASGGVKLGDFGTGIHAGDESGERVGTAFYMAPEIFEGSSASVRSDIYSLGVLAYEVIAGERPFVGDSYENLMLAHLSGFPKALVNRRTGLSKAESKAVAIAMSRESGRRYGSVREFREAFMSAAGLQEPTGIEPGQATGRASRKVRPADDQPDPGERVREPRGPFRWFRRRREDG